MASQFPPPGAEADEQERLQELHSYRLLDTPAEPQFDRIVALARVLFDTPISAISLVDEKRQWWKAQQGLEGSGTPRDESFCAHAMKSGDVFIVPDAREDDRFAHNPAVTGGPHIRFYAGAPLRSPGGHPLGAMCVISSDPRGSFSDEDRSKLKLLADIVGNEMELKRRASQAHKIMTERELEIREAHFRIKSSLGYATLLAELEAEEAPLPKLTAAAMAAWKQYEEAGGILNTAIKALRSRMTREEYTKFVQEMPGFAM